MKIVCLCGIDGSGKSSIIKLLKESGIADKLTFKSFNYRDNVKDFISQNAQISTASINNYSDSVKKSFVEAYAKDFNNFFKREIEPLQKTSSVIVCDRWFHCVLAFQEALNVNSIFTENLFHPLPKGDLVFHIYIDPKIAYARQLDSNDVSKKNLSLLEDYQNGYSKYFKKENLNLFKIQNENIKESTKIISEKINQLR